MRILNDVLREPITEEIQILMQRAYDAGRTRGREEAGRALQGPVESSDGKGLNADQSGMWVAMMNGIANRSFANNLKRLRRDLAELEEMVRLGAGIPGDEQRIEMIKGLFARLHKMAPVVPLILVEIESHFQTWH